MMDLQLILRLGWKGFDRDLETCRLETQPHMTQGPSKEIDKPGIRPEFFLCRNFSLLPKFFCIDPGFEAKIVPSMSIVDHQFTKSIHRSTNGTNSPTPSIINAKRKKFDSAAGI